MTPAGRFAYVTLIANPEYRPGVLALTRSLARTGTTAPLVVLATPEAGDLADLEAAGGRIEEVPPLPLSDGFRARHARPALQGAAPFTKGEKPTFHDPLGNFQKLRLWELTQFERVVFLDADTLVVRNIDRLFGYPEFAGAPNLYQTLADFHRLNAGVFVARPSEATFERMLARLDAPDAPFWRRTDQTFLETFWPDWHGLPYVYNTLQYVWFNLPELWYWPAIKVVHYQYEKPWDQQHPKRERLQPLIDLWWTVFQGGAPPGELSPAPA